MGIFTPAVGEDNLIAHVQIELFQHLSHFLTTWEKRAESTSCWQKGMRNWSGAFSKYNAMMNDKKFAETLS